MHKSKQHPNQFAENDVTPVKFWGTLAFTILGMLITVLLMRNALQLPKSAVAYLAMAVYVLSFIAAIPVIILIIRGRQKWAVQIAFFMVMLVFGTTVFIYTGRVLTSSFSLFTIAAIFISQLLPKELRRRYIVITGVSLAVIWVTDWISPSWRLTVDVNRFGPITAILFSLILSIIVVRQAWSGNIRVKLITAFTIVALVSVGILGTVTYFNYRNQVREDIRQRLLNIISITALQVDGELHTTVRTPEDMQSEAYQQMQAANADILATDLELAYIYSLRVDEQGTLKFVLDNGLEDGYKPVEVGVVYDDPSAMLVENAITLDHPIVEEEFYTDKYGTFLSAYAPIYRADGTREGIVGVDIVADKVIAAEQAVLRLTLITTVIAMVLVTILGLFLGNIFTNPIVHLSQVAQKIASGDLNARAEVETTDEVGDLAQTLNTMTSQLQATLDGLEQRVAARTRDLEIVAEVGTTTATILESKRLLQEVVDLTKERFNLYHSHIYLLDEKGENLVLTAGAGEPGRLMVAEGRSISLDREQSLVARAARERKGVTVNDVTQTPDFLPNPLLPDTRSELAVPMIVGGNVIGVFDIQSDQVGRFTDADVNIQTTLAAQLATSIQNVRSYEQSRKQAEFESLANAIGQKIQHATTIEDTLQTAIRELGTAVGASRVKANISASNNGSNN